jgi:hypothetical protein
MLHVAFIILHWESGGCKHRARHIPMGARNLLVALGFPILVSLLNGFPQPWNRATAGRRTAPAGVRLLPVKRVLLRDQRCDSIQHILWTRRLEHDLETIS